MPVLVPIEEKKLGPQQGTGIRCPKCGGQTRVIRSMAKPQESVHGRYRKCDTCNTRMYTEEQIKYIIEKKILPV